MTWIRLDDGMLEHPKWILALQLGGDGALHLWLRLTAWSSRHLTDGLIPAHVATSVPWPRGAATRAKAWQALAEAQLIERQSNGDWLLHDYLDYQPSRAKTLADRGRKAQNEQSRRDAARVARHDLAAPPERARSRPVPSRPDPVPIGRDPERAREPDPPSSPTVTEIRPLPPPGGSSRVFSLPSSEPTEAYLQEATMRAISEAQARSTWEHYWGAGLPTQGVERLHDWLLKRAQERAVSTARMPARASPRRYGSAQQDHGVDPFAFHGGKNPFRDQT